MRRRRKPLPAPRRDAGGRSRASSAVESVLGFGGGVLIARAPRRPASIGHLLSNDAINLARGRQEIVRSTRWCSPRPGIANRSSWLARRASRTSSRAPDASRANGRAPTDRRRSPRRPARDGAAGREARHVQRAHEGRARGPPPRPDRGQRHAHGRGQGGGRGRDQQRGHPRGTHLRPFRITPSLASIDRAPLRRTRRERARSSRRPRPALRLKRPHWLGRATVARALSSSASLASPFARRRDLTPPLPSTHRPPDPFASSPFIPAPPLTPRLRLSFLSPRWRGTAARRR